MAAITRRELLGGTALIGGAIALLPKAARADGFLHGTWIVRCSKGHDDQVDGITRNHECETCGEKSVDGCTADVVCPDGHASHVGGITESHLCTVALRAGGICGKQCRR